MPKGPQNIPKAALRPNLARKRARPGHSKARGHAKKRRAADGRQRFLQKRRSKRRLPPAAPTHERPAEVHTRRVKCKNRPAAGRFCTPALLPDFVPPFLAGRRLPEEHPPNLSITLPLVTLTALKAGQGHACRPGHPPCGPALFESPRSADPPPFLFRPLYSGPYARPCRQSSGCTLSR